MVGSPKHLSDLARVEADVRIVCRRCGFEEDWAPPALAEYLLTIGGSQVWSEITRPMRCRSFGCGSRDLRATPVPFARRAANMARWIGRLDAHMIGVALGVLESAANRSMGQAVATLEVRLALLVVHRYARDRECVRRFWTRASTGSRSVDQGLGEPLQLIRQRLVSAGWLPPVFLLDPPRSWPWDAPAPPGWLDGRRTGDDETDEAGSPNPDDTAHSAVASATIIAVRRPALHPAAPGTRVGPAAGPGHRHARPLPPPVVLIPRLEAIDGVRTIAQAGGPDWRLPRAPLS